MAEKKMTFEEYVAETKKIFIKSNPKITIGKIDKYFSDEETLKDIRADYNDYASENNIGKMSPSGTAYSLGMLF